MTVPQAELVAKRLKLLQAKAKMKRDYPLRFFKPYERQMEFFRLGAGKRERLLMAGNRVGKSEAGAFETACHLTGDYPEWWPGVRFDTAVRGWCGNVSAQMLRDVQQTKLCGPLPVEGEAWGTGFLAKRAMLTNAAGHGAGGGLDYITIRHASGGVSYLGFKTYGQTRDTWQGDTLDFVWIDEEPPVDIYSEALTRLTGRGVLYCTLTPLKGYTEFINRFMRDRSVEAVRDRGVVRMGLKHAEHFTEEQKQQRLAAYPAHERAAREEGDPLLGEGKVWEEVLEADIRTSLTLRSKPAHWPVLWGIDFGIAHPFAAVLLAWDRDADVIYILDGFRMSGGIPVNHASRMRSICAGAPVAWPHDGTAREKGSGEPLASLYKAEGLLMLADHATFAGGGYSTEAGIMEILGRMRDGRFKVAEHLTDWWDEFRTYHRKDGQIVKLNDDLMSATRIAVMAHRFAKLAAVGSKVVRREPGQIAKGVEDFAYF